MSERTKRFIRRVAWVLLWIVLCTIGLVDAVHDDSLARIISWSINIGMWVGLLTNYIIDQIIYLTQKRKTKNKVLGITESEKEALLECVSLSVEVPGGSIVAEVIKDYEVPDEKTGISVKYIPDNEDDEVEDIQEVYINYPIYGRLCVMANTSETTMFSYPKTLW